MILGIEESPSILIKVLPADKRREGYPLDPDLRSAAT